MDEDKSVNLQTMSTQGLKELEKKNDDPLLQMDIKLKKTYKNMREFVRMTSS